MKPISSLSISVIFALVLLPFSSGGAEKIIWKEDFKAGLGSSRPYRGQEPLEVIENDGERFLRIVLPGEQPLEGVRFSLESVEGNRLATISAKVRGSGTVGAMVQAKENWTRLPPLTLTDQWQSIEIPRTLKAGEQRLIAYFVSLPRDVAPQGMVFEIAGLQARLAPPLSLSERDVPPQRFEIEDYAPNPETIREADGVTGVVVNTSFASTEIPFPQTSKAVHLYLRYRAASPGDRISLCTNRGGAKQSVQEIRPQSEGWQWLTFSNVLAEEAGEAVTLEAWPSSGASQPAMLDAVVVTSEAALDETTLDSSL